MLLVILGAGASYDSAPSRHVRDLQYNHLQTRPPLANELFSDRHYFGEVLRKYPRCIDIVPRLRHLAGNSVETVLQGLQSEANRYPERLQQLASIRYYLQEILSVTATKWVNECQDVTNHRALLDDIRLCTSGERVCFVTFNYDLLIEYAFAFVGMPILKLSDFIAYNFMLIKLHGSVNWGRTLSIRMPKEVLRDRKLVAREAIRLFGYSGVISDRYVMTDGKNPPSPIEDEAVFPALAIPVQSKLEFECPKDHIAALKSFLPNVTKILVIGWRATEKPFLDLLKAGLGSKSPQIMIANGNEKDCIATDEIMTQCGIGKHCQIHPEGFSDLILSNKVCGFLNSAG